MQTRNSFRAATLALAALALGACAVLGLQPDSFNERVAVAYSTVSAVRDAAAVALDAGSIDVAEAENIQVQAHHARAAIDLARVVAATDPAQADAKLAATLTALQALSDYLRGLP